MSVIQKYRNNNIIKSWVLEVFVNKLLNGLEKKDRLT